MKKSYGYKSYTFFKNFLANLYGRVNIWGANCKQSIDLKVENVVPSLVTKELIDDIYEKVLAFLNANKFSGDEILKKEKSIFTSIPSHVHGLNEKLNLKLHLPKNSILSATTSRLLLF